MEHRLVYLKQPIYTFIFTLCMINFYTMLKSKGPLDDLKNLQILINSVEHENQLYALRNQELLANISFIQHNDVALEEEARLELGLIKPNEKFYQVVEPIE